MSIKTWFRAGGLPLCAVLFTLLAWGLAQWIPASARRDRWQTAASELSLQSPVAEVCAVANIHFRIQLSTTDVAVWRALVHQGMSPDAALRTVVTYARGRMEEKGFAQ